MEPVFLILGLAGIISGTIIRVKKLNMERERMRLGQPDGVHSLGNKRHGLLGKTGDRLASAIQVNTTSKSAEVQELQKRLENLETIIVGSSLDGGMVNGTAERLQEELRNVSERLRKLES